MPETTTLIIGDVHGCLEELEALVKLAGLGPADRVILVGDLVAKGPDSRGVLQLCRERGFLTVLGNHDAHVLRTRDPDEAHKVKGEHRQIAASLSKEDWEQLQATPLHRHLPELGVRVVHGGFVPGVPIERQRREDCLNLRSIKPDGSGSKKIEDGVPWASRWTGPDFVVFGHDALRKLQQYPHAWGLDTGCCYGGALTGVLLPEKRLLQVKARRVYKDLDD